MNPTFVILVLVIACQTQRCPSFAPDGQQPPHPLLVPPILLPSCCLNKAVECTRTQGPARKQRHYALYSVPLIQRHTNLYSVPLVLPSSKNYLGQLIHLSMTYLLWGWHTNSMPHHFFILSNTILSTKRYYVNTTFLLYHPFDPPISLIASPCIRKFKLLMLANPKMTLV